MIPLRPMASAFSSSAKITLPVPSRRWASISATMFSSMAGTAPAVLTRNRSVLTSRRRRIHLEMDIQMFVGGVENPYRANAIWARTGNGGTKPANIVGDPDAVELRMALRGLQGDEFDNYDTVIQDPNPIIVDAGDTWACVQIESPPEVHNERFPALIIDGEPLPEAKRQGISATWITHAMRVPLAEIEIGPDGLNRVGEPHDFTITVNSAFGFAGTLVITPTVSPRPDSQTGTCATPTIDGRIATCVFTINSDKPGIFTANAEAALDLGNGLSAHLSTALAARATAAPPSRNTWSRPSISRRRPTVRMLTSRPVPSS